MTEQGRDKLMCWLVGLAIALAGTILGAGVTWGSTVQRMDQLEDQVRNIHPLLHRLDRSAAGIEQMLRDYGRRIDRLEDGQ
jgi:hypothetical protein